VTLQDLGSIGEFVAAIATLLTLVYLALQIRENSRSVRAAAVDAAAERFIESLRLVALNPELAELLEEGHKDYAALSDKKKRRYRYHYFANSLQFENLFRKHRDGHLPEQQWEGIAASLRHVFRDPGTRQVWKELRLLLEPEFREFIDAMLENAARE
jgi:hypothetical protein